MTAHRWGPSSSCSLGMFSPSRSRVYFIMSVSALGAPASDSKPLSLDILVARDVVTVPGQVLIIIYRRLFFTPSFSPKSFQAQNSSLVCSLLLTVELICVMPGVSIFPAHTKKQIAQYHGQFRFLDILPYRLAHLQFTENT